MSYRGIKGFRWSADDGRSARVVAAVALLVAGWILGFFAGRVSAWVFPVANPDLAAIKASLASAQQQAVPREVPDPSPKETTQRPSLALSPGTTPPEQSSLKLSQPEAIAEPSPRSAVWVNPDWTALPVAESMPGAELNSATEAGIAACKRRFSSFRVSDGTYQPYGRSTRLRCPLLP